MIIKEVVSQRSDINDLNYPHAIFSGRSFKKTKWKKVLKDMD